MRKELNTSKSIFKDVIEHNLMYVDKTEEIHDLVNKIDGQFFLSRPRRFGKSINYNISLTTNRSYQLLDQNDKLMIVLEIVF